MRWGLCTSTTGQIVINWENIAKSKAENFMIREDAVREYGPYDHASIMHYGDFFFSSNDKPTIQPLLASVEIGQREAPSVGDINAIAMLYGSDLSLVSDLINQSETTEVHILVSNEL